MRSARKRALAIVTALAMLLAEPCMALYAEPAEAAGMTAEAGSITGTGEAETEAGEGAVSEEMAGAGIQEMLPEQAPGEAAPENGQAANEQDKQDGGQEQQNQNVPDSLPEISGGGHLSFLKAAVHRPRTVWHG